MTGVWVLGFFTNMGEILSYTILVIIAWECIFRNLIKKWIEKI
jgi:hypothetical protein